MPRAKRPLALAEPNASRLASNAKSSKTGGGKVKKTADGILQETYSGGLRNEESRRSDRNKSSDTLPSIRKSQKWLSIPKSAANPPPRTHLRSLTHMDGRITNFSRDASRSYEGMVETSMGGEICTMQEQDIKINYKTKDNSKLRSLLSDRQMSTSGSRKEWIARLEESPFDYDSFSAERLVEILNQRRLKNTGLGSKGVKIQRLILNDSLDRDTSNHDDMNLYVEVDVSRWALKELVAKQEAVLVGEDRSYSTSTWTLGKLEALLKQRKLKASGTKEQLIARLRSYDSTKLVEDVKKARKKHDSLKRQLKEQIGHPIQDTDLAKTEKHVDALDYEIQSQAQKSRPGIHICDYDGRNSHWASRSSRELWEICSRRGMPGHGPRAALLKWLETGSVEYEDLYAGSLETMCFHREIKCKSGEKKVDLIRLLKEADDRKCTS